MNQNPLPAQPAEPTPAPQINPEINPTRPDEEQSAQPNLPETEIDPTRTGETEVDLDRSKTETNPDTIPPERQ